MIKNIRINCAYGSFFFSSLKDREELCCIIEQIASEVDEHSNFNNLSEENR